jgi:hypothetical protein
MLRKPLADVLHPTPRPDHPLSKAGPPELQELFRVPHAASWLKLRPGARAFLRRAREGFEVWGASARGLAHAEAAAELLDERCFGGRILTAEPAGGGAPGAAEALAKRVAAALSGRQAAAFVVAGVGWPEDRRGVVAVEPYMFLPGPHAPGRGCLLEMGRWGFRARARSLARASALPRALAAPPRLCSPPRRRAEQRPRPRPAFCPGTQGRVPAARRAGGGHAAAGRAPH